VELDEPGGFGGGMGGDVGGGVVGGAGVVVWGWFGLVGHCYGG